MFFLAEWEGGRTGNIGRAEKMQTFNFEKFRKKQKNRKGD
jgi:hypothetical protein